MNSNLESKIIEIEKHFVSKNQIKIIEESYLKLPITISVGDILKIAYKIPEGDKERIQLYEGLVISKKNRGLGKSFTIRRFVDGIGLEQIFVLNSPKIASITRKQASKVRRAKLYFLRSLSGKSTRLKKTI
jgi:large subunit ribosomal protein L19